MSGKLAAIRSVDARTRPLEPVAMAKAAKTGFKAIISALRELETQAEQLQEAQTRTAEKGDTLWGICADALRESGESCTHGDIMTAVNRVARANGLESPDRIFVGQKLDMSAVRPPRAPLNGQTPELAQGGGVMPPVQWGMAVVSDAMRAARHEEPARMQPLLASSFTVTSSFGPRNNPFTGKREYHSGTDLAAPQGTPVYPVRPGKVTFSGWKPGYGKVVIMSHQDGTETLYAHHETNLAKRGAYVDWGTPIGRVGSTGNSTGPHLHFELRENGRPVNPAKFLNESVKVAKAS